MFDVFTDPNAGAFWSLMIYPIFWFFFLLLAGWLFWRLLRLIFGA
ncbi:MAG: hypothetical protein ABGZ35_32720 [Planctomycetaceae bacterium]